MVDINKLQGQYLTSDILSKSIPEIKVLPVDLGSSDSYHEQKILNKYLSLDKEGQMLIYKVAIQLSIIGYGNKNYGFIRLDKDTTITLIEIFNKYKIKYLEKINSKYSDDELSVRRLLRLFRYQIKQFIENTNRPSYLWLKYANKNENNLKFLNVCFPGGEHLVDTQEQCLFFLETYGNLDLVAGTKFRSRLKRVFIARGLLSPEYFIDKVY